MQGKPEKQNENPPGWHSPFLSAYQGP